MKSHSQNQSRHEFILDRIEGGEAVLLDEDDKETIIEAELMPTGVSDGDAVVLTISTLEEETIVREKKAKEILNEILGSKK